MANPRLQIDIGADNKTLKQVSKDSIKAIQGVENAAEKLGRSDLGDIGKKAGQGYKDLGKGAANALPALTDVSRIIQDAPFGIIGVGNNITQLASSFGNLQKKTGSAKGALQAIIGQLSGAGGLVFGISTAVTLLTVFSGQIGKLIQGVGGLSKAFKGALEEIGSQKAEIQSLGTIILDLSEDLETRQSALDELAKSYPQYLKGIDVEKTRYEDLKIALQGANQELLRKTKIEALSGAISDRYKENAEGLAEAYEAQDQALGNLKAAIERVVNRNQKLQEIDRKAPVKEQVRQLEQLAKRYGVNQRLLAGVALAASEYGKAQRQVRDANEVADEAVGGLVRSLTSLKSAQLENANAAEEFKKGLEETFDGKEIVLEPPKKVDYTKFLKKLAEDLRQQDLEDFATDLSNAVAIAVADSGYQGADAPDVDDSQIVAQEKSIEAAKEYTENLNRVIQFGVGNAFSNIGTLIGQGLANGDLAIKEFGKVVFAGLGQILSGFGDAAIQAGITSEALKKAILAPLGGGIGAIAAGVALKAFASTLTSSIQSAGSNIGALGGVGGIASSGGSTAAVSSPSVLTSGEQIVVFEIQGTKLVGVLNRTLQRQGRTISDII